MQFETYLDYQVAGGGLHIELGEVDWTIKAWATYSGPVPFTGAQYSNPANWTWTINAVSSKTVSTSPQLPLWGINVESAKNLYAYPSASGPEGAGYG
jgi:hypothetical protein